jgi:hypothetical protein
MGWALVNRCVVLVSEVAHGFKALCKGLLRI